MDIVNISFILCHHKIDLAFNCHDCYKSPYRNLIGLEPFIKRMYINSMWSILFQDNRIMFSGIGYYLLKI